MTTAPKDSMQRPQPDEPVEHLEPDLTPAPGTPRDPSLDPSQAGSDLPAGGEDPDVKRPGNEVPPYGK